MKKHWRLIVAALAVAAFFVILNHRAYDGFFQDDELDNLSWAHFVGAQEFFSGLLSPLFSTYNFRPVGHAYFILMWPIADWSFPAYITPVFGFHLLNGLLVFLLARKLDIPEWPALAGAAFFTLSGAALDAYWKPMYVFDLFCCTLCLLSLLSYRCNWYISSLLCFWLAYKSKELAVMLPAVLVLYEFWLGKKRFVRLIPFLLISLSFGLQGIIFNPNHHNDYAFQFKFASLAKTVPYYTGRIFLFPFGGLLLFLLVFLRDRRIWLLLSAMVLVSVPLLFLPGRIFNAYLYVPLGFASVAMAAALSKVKPYWALIALLVWMPFNVKQLRRESRRILYQDDEYYAFVAPLVQWSAKHPNVRTLVYSGVPAGLNHWGVTGAWNLAHNASGLKAIYFVAPEANEAHPRAYANWDGPSKTLTIREDQ